LGGWLLRRVDIARGAATAAAAEKGVESSAAGDGSAPAVELTAAGAIREVVGRDAKGDATAAAVGERRTSRDRMMVCADA
jgi:hypothetical protein